MTSTGVGATTWLSRTDVRETIRVGLIGGLVGGLCIWIYEAIVWVGVQHQMPLSGIPSNATGLTFGLHVQSALGIWAYLLGTVIHFSFALGWGVIFAAIWPYLRRRGIEATLAALPYAMLAWIVMHVSIMIVSTSHPDYGNSNVVIGGFMSHFCYAIPLALVVKRLLPERAVA